MQTALQSEEWPMRVLLNVPILSITVALLGCGGGDRPFATSAYTQSSAALDDGKSRAQSAPLVALNTADLNGDGRRDIVWQNMSTGDRYVWLMNGLASIGGASLGRVPVDWDIAATGDFDNDGKPDLLWQNSLTGDRYVWFLDGTRATGGQAIGNVPLEWQIAAAADFDHDGHTDIVWQNAVTGARYIWFMSGASYSRDAYVGHAPTEWSIAAAGDFNQDGEIDLVFVNTVTGRCWVWFMDRGAYVSGANLLPFPLGPEWSIVGAGDFNGDGKDDLIVQNPTTGGRFVRLMNGLEVLEDAALGVVPSAWSIVR